MGVVEEDEEIWRWFEDRFGEDAMNRYYGYEVNELIKEVKRRAICKKLDEIEKKLDWLIEFISLGLYTYKYTYTFTTSGNELKPRKIEGLEYKEPRTTDGMP